MKKNISLLIVLWIMSCAPEKNYFSNEWVNYKINSITKADTSIQEIKITKVNNILKKIKVLMKIRKDKEKNRDIVIEEAKKALDIYPKAEIFYYLGNALFNKNRKKAINAYLLSIDLKYKNVFLAYYNIACEYSLLKDIKNSIKYLKLALKHGYTSFNHIKKDSDLIFLRKHKEWSKLITEINNSLVRYIPFSIRPQHDGDCPIKHDAGIIFYFKKNGQITGRDSPALDEPTIKIKGFWQQKGYMIKFYYTFIELKYDSNFYKEAGERSATLRVIHKQKSKHGPFYIKSFDLENKKAVFSDNQGCFVEGI